MSTASLPERVRISQISRELAMPWSTAHRVDGKHLFRRPGRGELAQQRVALLDPRPDLLRLPPRRGLHTFHREIGSLADSREIALVRRDQSLRIEFSHVFSHPFSRRQFARPACRRRDRAVE
jgi:hypothetical protein